MQDAAVCGAHRREQVIVEGPHTPDIKGKASTAEVGAAVAEALRAQSKVPA